MQIKRDVFDIFVKHILQLREPRVIFQFVEILAVVCCVSEDRQKKSRSSLLTCKLWVENGSDFSIENFLNY
jgi:hypothetical protein